jgi:hypothetical protein
VRIRKGKKEDRLGNWPGHFLREVVSEGKGRRAGKEEGEGVEAKGMGGMDGRGVGSGEREGTQVVVVRVCSR